MTKAVIYARYSSSAQREESIEAQLRECRVFAETNDMKIVHEYTDKALSGKTDKRPGFQQMIKDSEKHLFEVVITYTLDRFARNRFDSATYKHKLKKNGVRVVYAKQDIPDSPEGIILESMLEGYAEYYSENLARNVKRGLKENLLNGKSVGGAGLCFGYQLSPDRRYEINEKEAAAVRDIFKLYDQGWTFVKIINYLNDLGYKTKTKQPFKPNSLKLIIRNRKYIGEFRYGDMVITDQFPPIIDEELFNRVQEKLEINRRSRGRHKAKEEYLLTTKLVCGRCGAYLVGDSGTSRTGETHRYYTCSNKKHRKGCKAKSYRKEQLEDTIMNFIYENILTDECIEACADKIMSGISNPDSEIEILKSSLKDAEKRQNSLVDAIENGGNIKTLVSKLKALESEIERYEEQIEELERQKIPLTKESIIEYLKSFRGYSLNTKHKIINVLIHKIYVYDDPETQNILELTTGDKIFFPETTGSDIGKSKCTEHGLSEPHQVMCLCISCLETIEFYSVIIL